MLLQDGGTGCGQHSGRPVHCHALPGHHQRHECAASGGTGEDGESFNAQLVLKHILATAPPAQAKIIELAEDGVAQL